MVRGGGVLMKEAMVRALANGSLSLSGRGLTALPDEFSALDSLEYDNKTWWQESDVVKLDLSHNSLTQLPENIDALPLLGGLQAVNLLENELTTLPEKLFTLPCLARLVAAKNKIRSVPEGLCHAMALQELDISSTLITTLPESLGNLEALKTLKVSNCGLTELPRSIGGCANLQTLDVSGNRLTHLPSGLVLLQKLAQFNCAKNVLEEFPDAFGSTYLTIVDLSQNKLRRIPDCRIESLKELIVSYNSISEVGVLYFPNLQHFDGRDNKLQRIDFVMGFPQIAHLNLCNNDVAQPPPELATLTQLSTLNLEGNPIRSIRRDVIAKGTVEILKYLKTRLTEEPVTEEQSRKNAFDDNKSHSLTAKGVFDISMKNNCTPMESIPVEAVDKPDVTTFRCNNHVLNILPQEICWLTNVTRLELSGNRLRTESFPPEFFLLHSLTHLELQKNRISKLTGFSELTELTFLDLSQNRLSDDGVCENGVSVFTEMPALSTLMLHNNALTVFPSCGSAVSVVGLSGTSSPPCHRVLSLDVRV